MKKKKLVIHNEEAKIVRLCFELYPKAAIKGKRACPVRTVAADELEEFLIDKFKELGGNQKLLKRSIEKANTHAKQGLDPLRRDKERTESQLGKVNQELKRLVDILKSTDLDKKQSRAFVKEVSELESSKEKLEEEIHRIETNMQHLNQHVIDADTFARLFREFPKVFETFSFDEKRILILLLVKEVIYTPTRLKVLFWGDLPEMMMAPTLRKAHDQKRLRCSIKPCRRLV